MNSYLDALYWWTVLYFFCSKWIKWMTVIEWLPCLWWTSAHMILCYLFICDPMPNGYECCFNHLYNLWVLIYISGLVKFVFERSLSGKKSQFLSKSVFCCYLGIYLYNLGYILSANKLASLPGNESAYLPWGNDSD